MKILCLGNEFFEEDSLAKKVGKELSKAGMEIVNIKDSFQLMEALGNKEVVLLDVVKNLRKTRIISIDELKNSKIMSAHDFDAGFVLKLLKPEKVKLIGIPQKGDEDEITMKVKELID